MKNIITVQHTQSIHYTNGMIGSWTAWDLSDLGIRQAKNIGEKLGNELKNKNYIMYSSDLLRAKHTAEIIAKYLKTSPILTDVLRERNLGTAVGKNFSKPEVKDWYKVFEESYSKYINGKKAFSEDFFEGVGLGIKARYANTIY